MDVEIGQTVYVPDLDGHPVRGTVIARGEPGDAVEMNVDGHAVKRDVAIVRHEEGKSQVSSPASPTTTSRPAQTSSWLSA